MRGYLGLGSNRGNRRTALTRAREALARRGVRITTSSSLYETEPQGELADQPDFLNAVVAIETALAPHELLDLCKEVERELGREADGPRHGPRPIDIDLLLLGDLELADERLTLPHADLTKRRFVLEPLLELAPDLRLPDGTSLARLLDEVANQRVEPAGSL